MFQKTALYQRCNYLHHLLKQKKKQPFYLWKKHYLFFVCIILYKWIKNFLFLQLFPHAPTKKRHSQKRGIQKGKSARNDNVSNSLLFKYNCFFDSNSFSQWLNHWTVWGDKLQTPCRPCLKGFWNRHIKENRHLF